MELNSNEKEEVSKKESKNEKLAEYSLVLIILLIPLIILSFVLANFSGIIYFIIIPIICSTIAIILSAKALKTKKRKLAIGCIISLFIFIVVYGYLWISICDSPMEDTMDAKPIIYLYPEEETKVEVELPKNDRLIVSYPKYEDSWKVIAKENGDLVYLETGRNLYSLYYESKNAVNFKIEDEGFVVKGEDTAKFLEEKLEILGLNEREAEEFIIYWLPKLEENKYNYIRFASKEEIEENMPLEISPKPDTTIRVLMTYKGLENKIEVKEQKLEQQERKGFVAVEWGGTEIK